MVGSPPECGKKSKTLVPLCFGKDEFSLFFVKEFKSGEPWECIYLQLHG